MSEENKDLNDKAISSQNNDDKETENPNGDGIAISDNDENKKNQSLYNDVIEAAINHANEENKQNLYNILKKNLIDDNIIVEENNVFSHVINNLDEDHIKTAKAASLLLNDPGVTEKDNNIKTVISNILASDKANEFQTVLNETDVNNLIEYDDNPILELNNLKDNQIHQDKNEPSKEEDISTNNGAANNIDEFINSYPDEQNKEMDKKEVPLTEKQKGIRELLLRVKKRQEDKSHNLNKVISDAKALRNAYIRQHEKHLSLKPKEDELLSIGMEHNVELLGASLSLQKRNKAINELYDEIKNAKLHKIPHITETTLPTIPKKETALNDEKSTSNKIITYVDKLNKIRQENQETETKQGKKQIPRTK